MAKRIGGFRCATRQIFKKGTREKGKISITRFFQQFKAGDKVMLHAEPAYQKGMYFPRFHSKSGVIAGKKGRCYEVQIKDYARSKTLIVHPVHLKKI